MYVCICKAITDKQLEDAKKSSQSLREICQNLGLGSECGACIQEAIQVIQKSSSQKQSE
jgi:bacterioferritin-associated ferredoxin